MVQVKIAFLDEEEAYLEQLKGYLVRKTEQFFQVWTFSEVETFCQVQMQAGFDAVVLTAACDQKLEGRPVVGKKILLCEGAWKEEAPECLYVQKYQSAEKLLCQISAMLWQEKGEEKAYVPDHAAELIGIYSPVHHEGQMLFSMTMAQILGEEQKVLYVNLMEHSGFYGLTGVEAPEDIGDLIYGMMQTGHDFLTGLHKVRQSYRNFDYIPPAVNPEHMSEISMALYEQLLMALKNRSGYDIVMVDFGMVFLGFAALLPVFSDFYCLGKAGLINRFRMEEFLDYLGKEGGHTMEHMNRLLLPEEMPFEAGNPLDHGLYGSLGDVIRSCLYGGMQIGG